MRILWCLWVYVVFSCQPLWERCTDGLPLSLELSLLLLLPWCTGRIGPAALWGLILGLSADALSGSTPGPRMLLWCGMSLLWAALNSDRLRLGPLLKSAAYVLICMATMSGLRIYEQWAGLCSLDRSAALTDGLLSGAASGILGVALLLGPGPVFARLFRPRTVSRDRTAPQPRGRRTYATLTAR